MLNASDIKSHEEPSQRSFNSFLNGNAHIINKPRKGLTIRTENVGERPKANVSQPLGLIFYEYGCMCSSSRTDEQPEESFGLTPP
jgi:hypothetical protein